MNDLEQTRKTGPFKGEKGMFLNREEELAILEEALTSNKSILINMYGKRRLGKTELLIEITRRLGGKYPVLYYQFTEVPSKLQLEEISHELKNLNPRNVTLQAAQIGNWESFFNIIMTLDRLIVLFDEFPYLVEVDSSIPSVLQKVWDRYKKTSNTKILLCGSYVSIMEELMGKDQPLYGRFDYLIPIMPFNFLGLRDFLPDISFRRQIELYLIFGGNPYYLDGIKGKHTKNLDQLLIETAFSKYSALSQEVPLEFRTFSQKPHLYMGTLLAITKGRMTISKIADSIKVSSSNVPRILNILIGLHMIKRVEPFLTKKPIQYQICDQYTRFWMKYLLKKPRFPDNYVKKTVIPSLGEFLSKPGFEEFCKELLLVLSSQNKFSDLLGEVYSFIDEIPSGKNIPKESLEIDIIAFGSEMLVFCECKWTNKAPQIEEITNFMRKCQTFMVHSKSRYNFPLFKFKKIKFVYFTREEATITKLPSDIAHIKLVSISTIKKWIESPQNPSEKLL